MIHVKNKNFKITKAVIPAAGFGTRFLPWTKAAPKEMLPILDKPVIQIIVEELVEAGIKEIIFVVNKNKKAIRDYFSPHPELEELLIKNGKENELKEIRRLDNLAKFHFVEQLPLGKGGTGVAILSAEKIIGRQPFLVLWGDDFVVAQPSRSKQLLACFKKYQGTIFSCFEREDPESGLRYGFVQGEEIEPGVLRVDNLVEKPGFGKQPTPYAVVSGFIFLPSIFENLKKAVEKYGQKREIHYNIDGVLPSLNTEPAYALMIKNAKYYDTGNKLEYLKTVVDFGLKDKNFGEEFKKFLNTLG